MSKEKLQNRLDHLRNSWVMGLAADACFADPRVNRILENTTVEIGGLSVNLRQIAAALCREDARDQLRFEFRKTFFRSFAAEPYEVVEKYAAVSKQMEKFKSQDWYPIAKLVRNTVRHGTIEFHDFLRSKLPIVWRRRTVTIDDAGKLLETIFDYEDAFWLLQDLDEFVKRDLE